VPMLYHDHIEHLTPIRATQKYFKDPATIFDYFVLVLKSATPQEKGAIVVYYNHILPAFARLFDIPRIASKYYLIMEPTWNGYCTMDVLAYCQYQSTMFVETHEPHDAAFIDSLSSNLVPISLAINGWVDHRLFRPLPGAKKDFDVVMVANWARYKRHLHFFAAIRKLRQQGHSLRVLLLGYAHGTTTADILQLAEEFGIADQLDIQENVPYERMNEYLNRAKIHVLWSRREGANRAIIEAMFAGVPCLLREGFNYGHKYPFINDKTGRYATERGLPETMLWMVENYQTFSPHDWVMANMTCQKSTEILNERIRAHAQRVNEPWTEGLAVKYNELNGLRYWDPEERKRFESDYAFLRTTVRGG
jgi:glycosyltransferase involved in cell wall biosynthesis